MPLLDMTQSSSLWQFFIHSQVLVGILTTAYTAVDSDESQPVLAKVVNALAFSILIQAGSTPGNLIHISTNYVFNAARFNP